MDHPGPVVEFENIDAMCQYLDDLRDSGATNMFGAAPYLAEAFDIPKSAARRVLSHWMQTFADRHPKN